MSRCRPRMQHDGLFFTDAGLGWQLAGTLCMPPIQPGAWTQMLIDLFVMCVGTWRRWQLVGELCMPPYSRGCGPPTQPRVPKFWTLSGPPSPQQRQNISPRYHPWNTLHWFYMIAHESHQCHKSLTRVARVQCSINSISQSFDSLVESNWNAGIRLKIKLSCIPPVNTLPCHGWAQSLWDDNCWRWGLQLGWNPHTLHKWQSKSSEAISLYFLFFPWKHLKWLIRHMKIIGLCQMWHTHTIFIVVFFIRMSYLFFLPVFCCCFSDSIDAGSE